VESRPKPHWGSAIFVKALVGVYPAALVTQIVPHNRVVYCVALVAGVLLQAIIPPHKRGLIPLLVVVSVISGIYLLIG